MALLTFTALSLSFASAALVPPALDALPAVTRYVDYEAGDDNFTGLSPLAPYKHAPGDSRATHGFTPTAGQHVAFKGGSRYYGRVVTVSGVTYSGNAWGSGRSHFDGADYVAVRTPTDQADAGGMAGWNDANVRVAEWTDDGLPNRLFDAAGMLAEGQQYRNPGGPAMVSDVERVPGLYLEADYAEILATNACTNAELAAQCSGEVGRAIVWFFVTGAKFVQRGVVSVVGNVVTFDGAAPDLYTDRPARLFVENCLKNVTLPGDYSVIAPGKAVVRIRDGDAAIKRGFAANVVSGTYYTKCFEVSGRSNVTIRGFRFSGYTGEDCILFRSGGSVSGWRIHDNIFEWLDLLGGAVVSTPLASDVLITHNRFRNFRHVSNCVQGSAADTVIMWNVMHTLNATACKMNGAFARMHIRYNIITDANGVHGNGISYYGDTRDFDCEWNAVIDTARPMTTQASTDGLSLYRSWRDNIFWARGPQSYGWASNDPDPAGEYEIARNLCRGSTAGITIYKSQFNVTLNSNWSTNGVAGGGAGEPLGINISNSTPDNTVSWAVNDNEAVSDSYLADNATALSFDQVNVLRPDGSRFHLDLRAVAA